jgi:hypothetical protein
MVHVDLSVVVQTLLCTALVALAKWVWSQAIHSATLTAEFRSHVHEDATTLREIREDIRELRRAA